MQFGRRMYFKKSDGSFITDIGELTIFGIDSRYTTVEEDLVNQPILSSYSIEDLIYVELEFGEHKDDFDTMGSCYFESATQQIIFLPRLSVTSDVKTIKSDNIDVAEITINVPYGYSGEMRLFLSGEYSAITCENGIAKYNFKTGKAGMYSVGALHEEYGEAVVLIQAIPV